LGEKLERQKRFNERRIVDEVFSQNRKTGSQRAHQADGAKTNFEVGSSADKGNMVAIN
jgi:hypothetical protein